jgi:hypothetical protein
MADAVVVAHDELRKEHDLPDRDDGDRAQDLVRERYRVGPKVLSWPKILTVDPY